MTNEDKHLYIKLILLLQIISSHLSEHLNKYKYCLEIKWVVIIFAI